MIENVKRILLISLIVLGLIMIYKIPGLLINKNTEPLPEVKLKETNDRKSFAIMIQNENGYEEYKSEDNTWPGNGYVFKEAKCTDNNGTLVEGAVTFADGKVNLTTNQTIYCILYFDEKPKSTTDILREKDTQGYLSSNLQGGMYRYQASFPECNNANECENASNMSNWICFGTADNCGTNANLIDKYMYRIIGITEEGEMYLIKETVVKEGSETSFTWNDKYYTSGSSAAVCDNKVCPEWNTSLLFKRLNGTSNGTTPGTGTTSNNANTDIFVDSTQYDYIKSGDSINGTKDNKGSEWYQLIANHEWMYGDTITGDTYTGDTIYAIEIGKENTKHYVGTDGRNVEQTYKWPEANKVKAKISLMYIHDYVYSYYDGLTEDSRGNPKNYSTAQNGWLFFQKDGYNTSSTYEWLSTRYGVFYTTNPNVYARCVNYFGHITNLGLYGTSAVRPVFYLSSKAKIANGYGTKSDPFILEIQSND